MSSPTHGSDYRIAIGKSGGLQHLSALITALGASHSEIVWRGLHCISLLSSESSNCDRMGDVGFCDIVNYFLVQCSSDNSSRDANNNEAMVNCLAAMKHLCDSSKNQKRLLVLGSCELVMKLMQRYLARITGDGSSSSSSSNDKRTSRSDSNSDNNISSNNNTGVSAVIEWCARVIYNMSFDNEEVKNAFHDLNCCEILVSSLSNKVYEIEDGCNMTAEAGSLSPGEGSAGTSLGAYHIGVGDNLLLRYEWTARAISSICQQHDANKEAFSKASGCEVVPDLIRAVFAQASSSESEFLSSKRSAMANEEEKAATAHGDGAAAAINKDMTALVESLLSLVADTAYPRTSNQDLYVNTSIAESVIEVLSQTLERITAENTINSCQVSTSASVVVEDVMCIEAAVKAIRSLCHDHEPLLSVMFDLHAENLILSTLRCFGDKAPQGVSEAQVHSITQWSLFVLCSLGSSPERRELLAKKGVCADVSNTLLKQVRNAEVDDT